jgi:hypothetical protein
MGEQVVVQVNPRHPERSYYPTGFGWIESMVLGVFGLAVWFFLLGILFVPFLR